MSNLTVKGNASGTGTVILEAPNTNSNRTITLPDATGTVVTANASGFVGIGTSSPSEELHVYSANNAIVLVETAAGSDSRLRLLTANDRIGYIEFGDTDDIDTGEIRYEHSTNAMIFATNGNVDRMSIDSSGNLLVNTTGLDSANGTGVTLQKYANGSYITIAHTTSAGTGEGFMGFYRSSTQIGSITQNGTTGVSYNTSSDYRLKENVAPMQNALDTVAQLNPVTYTWKADGSAGQGFIAHELQAVVPDCVTGEKDAVDAEGNPQYQGVDTSFLVATLVKAIQELTARVAELEAN